MENELRPGRRPLKMFFRVIVRVFQCQTSVLFTEAAGAYDAKKAQFSGDDRIGVRFLFLLPGPATVSKAILASTRSWTTTSRRGYEYRPSEGTAAGLHEYDHRLEDLSQERAIGGSRSWSSRSGVALRAKRPRVGRPPHCRPTT